VDFLLTGGPGRRLTQALTLLGRSQTRVRPCRKGYDTDAIVEHLASIGAQAVIPPKSTANSSACTTNPVQTAQPYRTLLLPSQKLPPLATGYDKNKAVSKPSSLSLALNPASLNCRYG